MQQSQRDTQMLALKLDERGAPVAAEAVRQRCSHIAAAKARGDQVFGDQICGISSARFLRRASCKAFALTVGWSPPGPLPPLNP